MNARIVKVTDKGQISIPVSMQESVGIQKGDELLVIKSNDALIIKKMKERDFRDLLKHSEQVAARLWGSKEDDIWDTV